MAFNSNSSNLKGNVDEVITAHWSFTENVTVPNVPVEDSDAASKAYVDAATGGGGLTLPLSAANGGTGFGTLDIGDNELLLGSGGAWVQRSYLNGTSMNIVDNGSSLVFNALTGAQVLSLTPTNTTDATPASVLTFTFGVIENTLASCRLVVRAVRTGGVSTPVTSIDGAHFERIFRAGSDTANAYVGFVNQLHDDADDTRWVGPTISVAGNTFTITVAGATDTNITWEGELYFTLTQYA